MKQNEKLKHFKKYKVEGDYITVQNLALNKEVVKPLHEVDYKGKPLEQELLKLVELIKALKDENIRLKEELDETKKLVNQIVKGLYER